MMADRERTLRLLKTARGQIDGIIKMVEDDRYCIDISTQLMATQSLLGRVNADVLKAHLEHCVATAASSGSPAEREEKLLEVERIIEKASGRSAARTPVRWNGRFSTSDSTRRSYGVALGIAVTRSRCIRSR